MKDWYLVGSRPVYLSGDESDIFNEYATDGFSELIDSPVGSSVVLYSDDLSNYKSVRCIIKGKTKDGQDASLKLDILTELNAMNGFSYVQYDGYFWLITSRKSNNMINQKASLELCNYEIKWQNASGQIVQRKAIVTSASKYADGEDKGKQMILGSDQLGINIPIDSESLNIDHGKMFIIDNGTLKDTVYQLTSPNNVVNTYNGYGTTAWIVQEMQYELTANDISYGVVGYVEPTQENPTVGKYSVITGNQHMKLDRTRKYSVEFYDGEALQNITANWVLDGQYKNYVTKGISGNTIELILYNEDAIGSTLTLSVTNSNYQSEISILVEGI